MKVLHVISSISRQAGGPSRSCQGLVAAECAAGVDAWVYSFDGMEPWLAGVRRFECSNVLNVQNVRMFDLVHIHGIWDIRLHKVAVMCRRAGVKYVIAPRGMLEPWSLKQKWLKKRIARFLYQDRDLKLAAALHATAESEAAQFRRLGFKNQIIVSPNGVNVPEGVFEAKPKGEGEQWRALFVSRMHPKKGVLELAESWARVKKEVERKGGGGQWCVELVYTMNGDEERAYEQRVKQRILELGMSYQDKDGTIHCSTSTSRFDFLFTGPLDDNAKWDAYARADIFVLPTYSENFGIVVAEALWAGVPVITTKGTPWKELEDCHCGWWINLPEPKFRVEVEQWRDLDHALSEACCADDLREMGLRGRQLVESKYTWKAVVGIMKHGYEQALNDCEFAPCDSCRNYGDTCPIK